MSEMVSKRLTMLNTYGPDTHKNCPQNNNILYKHKIRRRQKTLGMRCVDMWINLKKQSIQIDYKDFKRNIEGKIIRQTPT